MTLLGLPVQQLLLIVAGVGAALTLLYILKLRRRQVVVPFVPLWQRVVLESESRRLFSRLRRLLSLLLQLLFLALVVAALGDPRLGARFLDGRTLVLLLDASASMQALDENGRSRLEAALGRSRELIRSLGARDQLMVVRMDSQVTPLSPFTDDEQVLLDALDSVQAADTGADLPRALAFCADALRGRTRPLLVVATDGAFSEEVLASVQTTDASPGSGAAPRPSSRGPGAPAAFDPPTARALRGLEIRHLAVGRTGENLGIVAFNARRYPRNKRSFEVFLEVHNFSEKDRVVDIQLHSDGQLIDMQRLTLQAGERTRFACDPRDKTGPLDAWCKMAALGEVLEARLVPTQAQATQALDAFPQDDRAYALLPPKPRQRILLVTPGNLYLEGALLLDESLEVVRIRPEAYRKDLAQAADAVIFDRFLPDGELPGAYLALAPPRDRSPVPVKGELAAPLITEQHPRHPVMRWVVLKDVNISRSMYFNPGASDEVLAQSFRDPLIVARRTRGQRAVVVGFDATRSDLPLRVAFPLLIVNSLDWFAGESDALLASFRTGVPITLPAATVSRAAPTHAAVVEAPDGTRLRVPVLHGALTFTSTRAGVHTLRLGDETLKVAVNLADANESDIRPRRPLRLGDETRPFEPPSAASLSMRRELWMYFLMAALLLGLVEWFTYNRRLTV